MWSCAHCNRIKGDYDSAGSLEKRGLYIIRPECEDPRYHIELKEFRVHGKTKTGEFNVKKLILNRSSLIKLRTIRREMCECEDFIAHGLSVLKSIRIDRIDKKMRYKFLHERQELIEQIEEADKIIDEIIEENSKSPYLDPDETITELKKDLKSYLHDIGADVHLKRKRRREKHKNK